MKSSPQQHSLEAWFSQRTGWADAALPDYDGGSVANVPATILRAFDVIPPPEVNLLPPLRKEVLDPSLLQGARIIVLIIIDGLSNEALSRASRTARVNNLPPRIATLTSVFPSTTAAALTSLHFGVAPARHGIGGYTLYLPGQRRVVNMVHFKPVDGGAFTRTPPDPTRLVRSPSVFALLALGGVESIVISHREYSRSPLTRMHSGDTPFRGHRTVAEFAALLRHAVDTSELRFVFGYWAGLDMLSHTWGPDSPEAEAELSILVRALDEGVTQPVQRSGRDIALLICADHGHHSVDPQRNVSIAAALRSAGGQRHPPTGERRAMGITLRHPERRDVFQELVADNGVLLDVQDALDAGLYGTGQLHPELRERIGDILLVARGATTYMHSSVAEKEHARGAHGSLASSEMHVPLLVERYR